MTDTGADGDANEASVNGAGENGASRNGVSADATGGDDAGEGGAADATTDAGVVDAELRRRARELLEPGEIELDGLIVHTDLDSGAESLMHRATVEVGEIIAAHAAPESDIYVHSGTDDPEFGLNQHQGLTVEGDAFVWECQQLLREGSYDVVFYYEASADREAIVEAAREAGYRVTGVEGP
jgi:hypothetical protein